VKLVLMSPTKKETAKMTMNEAIAALKVPANKANNNCVQDAQWRLREAIALASWGNDPHTAPSYVVKAVNDLKSWL
jgi:hypothetical protein